MIRRTASLYIVAYVISRLIVVEGHQRLLSLHPSTRLLIPVRMYQYPQSLLKHCPVYNACLKCCTNWHNTIFTTSSTPFKVVPMWDSTVPVNRKEQADTKPLFVYSMPPPIAPMSDKSITSSINNVSQTAKLSDESTTSSINNVSQTAAVILKNSSQTSESTVINQNSFVNVKASSSSFWYFFNHTASERRSNPENISVDTTIQALQQNTKDMQTTCNESTTVPPLGIPTSQQVPQLLSFPSSFDASCNSTETGHKINRTKRDILFCMFKKSLDLVERKFLLSVFNKFTSISPENRRENGISFLQSGLFLHQLLMSLSITMDKNATQEIDEYLGVTMSDADKIEILNRTVAWLPKSSNDLKFRWASRLVLQRAAAGPTFYGEAARAVPLHLSWLSGNETAAHLTETLNNMVLSDSGGSMHDTFSEEEVSSGVCAAALGTAYVRGLWRAAPTLLNDTLPFRDAPAAPQRSSRFFRLNDIMGYAYMHEWNAEAIEISYATPGLTLLILVPKEPTLRALVERAASTRLDAVLRVMHSVRAAVTLPLYTLRMTLLLPNKLQDMGMPSLLRNGSECRPARLSHAVQRLMFWAEAGRNAFKDDGIEWDPRPELEILVDRPYLFFVRWENITLMNGVFVL